MGQGTRPLEPTEAAERQGRAGAAHRPGHPRGLDAARVPGGIPPPSPLPGPGLQRTPDFSQIDFDRLWEGRERVTEVEGAILRRVLGGAPRGRALEVGSGGGRLTPFVGAGGREVVAVDATLSHLRHPRPHAVADLSRLGANVYRLPFADQTFACATLVRVLGFLTDPLAALKEIHRVLVVGGLLVLSFEPHPSVGTLVADLKVAMAPRTSGHFRPMTFSSADVVPVRPSAFPAWSHSRVDVRRLSDAAAFTWGTELPCGLEDLSPFRRLPSTAFLGLADALARMGGFPSRFVVLRRDEPPSRVPMTP